MVLTSFIPNRSFRHDLAAQDIVYANISRKRFAEGDDRGTLVLPVRGFGPAPCRNSVPGCASSEAADVVMPENKEV